MTFQMVTVIAEMALLQLCIVINADRVPTACAAVAAVCGLSALGLQLLTK